MAILLLAVVLLSTAITSVPARAQSTVSGRGLDTLASCLRERNALDVLLLVDESGSLATTDAQNKRVVALRTALDGLGQLSRVSRDGRTPQIGVYTAGFSVGLDERRDWTPLTPDNIDGLVATANEFAERNQGADTDYYQALLSAQDILKGHAASRAAGSPKPCQAIIWFTDGGYSIGYHPSADRKLYAPEFDLSTKAGEADAVAFGRDGLCRRDGLADALRQDEIVDLVVALKLSDTAQLDDPSQGGVPAKSFLESLAIGHSGQFDCGDGATGNQFGAFLSAEDLLQLPAMFYDAICRVTPGCGSLPPVTVKTCLGDQACTDGKIEFLVDESVVRFTVLAQASTPDLELLLRSPGGAETRLPIGQPRADVALGAATAASRPLSGGDAVIEVALDQGANGNVGIWSAVAVDPTKSHPGATVRLQVNLYTGLRPAILGDPQFHLGEPAVIEVQLVGANGQPTSAAGIRGSLVLTSAVTDPITGTVTSLGDSALDSTGRARLQYTPPRDTKASSLSLTTRLSGTVSDGVTLAPSGDQRDVHVVLDPGLPSIVTSKLELSPVGGDPEIVKEIPRTARGSIELAGSAVADGQACLRSAPITSQPSDTGSIAVVLGTCVAVPRAGKAELPVEATPQTIRTGLVEGSIEVELSAPASQVTSTQAVPFEFEMFTPRIVGRPWLQVIVWTLLAALVPILLLRAWSWYAARFRDAAEIRFVEVPFVLRDGTLSLKADGAESAFTADPEELVFVETRARSIRASGTSWTIRPRSYFLRLPVALLDDARGPSIGPEGATRFTARAVLPHGVVRGWALTIDKATIVADNDEDPSGGPGDARMSDGSVQCEGTATLFADRAYGWQERFAETVEDLVDSATTEGITRFVLRHRVASRRPDIDPPTHPDESGVTPDGSPDGDGGASVSLRL